MDGKGKILEETAYENTRADAKEFAGRMKREYGRRGQCRAACETTGNMWLKTFEEHGIGTFFTPDQNIWWKYDPSNLFTKRRIQSRP